jgi:hypothetical protein
VIDHDVGDRGWSASAATESADDGLPPPQWFRSRSPA